MVNLEKQAHVSLEEEKNFYKAFKRSAIIYDTETRVDITESVQIGSSVKMRILRSIPGKTLRNQNGHLEFKK